MDNRTYLTLLFDYYEELFNNKQKQYFKDYYFHNLSLSEISENDGVSRNAIHRQIKIVEDKLIEYEDKLMLYDKGQRINRLLKEIDNDKIANQIRTLI